MNIGSLLLLVGAAILFLTGTGIFPVSNALLWALFCLITASLLGSYSIPVKK